MEKTAGWRAKTTREARTLGVFKEELERLLRAYAEGHPNGDPREALEFLCDLVEVPAELSELVGLPPRRAR